MAFADAGYQVVAKSTENPESEVVGHVALRPGKRRALDASRQARSLDQIERLKEKELFHACFLIRQRSCSRHVIRR
jgi:IS5 family transposase